VKNPIACAILTSTLAYTFPALAQDAPQPAAPPAAPAMPAAPAAAPDAPAAPAANPPGVAAQLFDPALLQLYMDVMKDIRRVTNHHATLKERVDLMRNFSLAPNTRAEFQEVFGNDNPVHVSVEDLPQGGAAIHGSTDVLDHTDAKTGATIHFDPVTFESVVNRDYKGVKYTFSMPGVKVVSPTDPKIFEFSDITVSADDTVGPYNFLIGKSTGKFGRMRIGSPDSFALDFNDISFDGNVSVHKKLFDVAIGYRVASIDWGKDKLEDVRTDFGVVNIDAESLEKLVEFSESFDIGKQPDAAQTDAVMKMLKRFAVDISRHNGAIEIRDFSAQYHGQRAGVSGRIALPNVKQSDLDSVQKTYEKLVLRLRLHVPTQMIDDISHRVARSMMEAQAKQNGSEVTDVAVDLVARGVVGKITDTLVKQQKWAHMEKDELVTVFEIRRGKMYLDGHIVNAKSNPFLAMAQGK